MVAQSWFVAVTKIVVRICDGFVTFYRTKDNQIHFVAALHLSLYISIYLSLPFLPRHCYTRGGEKNIPDKKRLYGTFFFGVYPIDFRQISGWWDGDLEGRRKKIIRLSIKYRMSSGFPPDICHPDNKFYVDRESLSQVGLNISGLNYQFVYLYAFMSTGKVYLMWDLRFQGLDICMLLCRLGKFISSWT